MEQRLRYDHTIESMPQHADDAVIIFQAIIRLFIIEAAGQKGCPLVNEAAAVDGVVYEGIGRLGVKVGHSRRLSPKYCTHEPTKKTFVVMLQRPDGLFIISGGDLIVGIQKTEIGAAGYFRPWFLVKASP